MNSKWVKGMPSPNPAGRPKDGLKRLARAHGAEIAEKLLAIVRATPAADPSLAQMAAFNLLLAACGSAWMPPAEPPPQAVRSVPFAALIEKSKREAERRAAQL
jgi:hypothetical protein